MGEEKTQWHPAFCSAVRLDLKDYAEWLSYTDEYSLTNRPLSIDLLVIKKEKDVIINNTIGKIFRQYNVLEYKSPKDKLNIDTFYKSIAYACLYKVSSTHVNEIKGSEITVSMVRDKAPVKMLKELEKAGFKVEKKYDGVYYITGSIFPTQILVTSKLDKENQKWLKSLTKDITETEYLDITNSFQQLTEENKKYADIVYQAVISANESKIEQWKERDSMCEAMRRIMAKEIDEEVSNAATKGVIIGKITVYLDLNLSIDQIAEKTGLSEKEVQDIIDKNNLI
jgi:hypothetical protein